MPKDEEDEDDDINDPFDFFKMFSDPSKIFQSKQFKGLFNNIFENILNNLPPEFQGLDPEEIKREFMRNRSKFGFKGPFMYGFNINIGPDGKPTFDSFGTIKQKSTGEATVKKAREPLVEVNEEADQIVVIAEMPGITKEDIEIKATSRTLTISSKSTEFGRNYYKEIDLPAAINSNVAKARYQNGILEVKLKKIDEKQTNIKID
ncbi:MAG: archaeal heat shock protein Hsp20 [Promethearchaeota archaeon]